MLRVGLTGELSSGKSTVAGLFAGRGAIVMNSDEMARATMQPGEPVFAAIVERFGSGVLAANGALDRRELARLAFAPEHPRVEELNAIVHPAVLAAQEVQLANIAREQPDAVVVIESALIFSAKASAVGEEPWLRRFDRIVLVTAPDEVKIERFLARSAAGGQLPGAEVSELKRDAEARLRAQRLPSPLPKDCLILSNAGDLARLDRAVDKIWQELVTKKFF